MFRSSTPQSHAPFPVVKACRRSDQLRHAACELDSRGCMFGHEFAANTERLLVPVRQRNTSLVHRIECHHRKRRKIRIHALLVHRRQSLLVSVQLGLKGRIIRTGAFANQTIRILFHCGNVLTDFRNRNERIRWFQNSPEATGSNSLSDRVDLQRISIHHHESEVGSMPRHDGRLHASRNVLAFRV